MIRFPLILLIPIAGLVGWGAWSSLAQDASDPLPMAGYVPPATSQPISPIPRHLELDSRKVALGQRLFHEPRLFRDDADREVERKALLAFLGSLNGVLPEASS
ncbi:MAG: hypothetical protein R6W97_12565 [Thiobacillus sp.]